MVDALLHATCALPPVLPACRVSCIVLHCSVLMRLLRRNPLAALDLHVPASSAEGLALTSPAQVRPLVCAGVEAEAALHCVRCATCLIYRGLPLMNGTHAWERMHC